MNLKSHELFQNLTDLLLPKFYITVDFHLPQKRQDKINYFIYQFLQNKNINLNKMPNCLHLKKNFQLKYSQ